MDGGLHLGDGLVCWLNVLVKCVPKYQSDRLIQRKGRNLNALHVPSALTSSCIGEVCFTLVSRSRRIGFLIFADLSKDKSEDSTIISFGE